MKKVLIIVCIICLCGCAKIYNNAELPIAPSTENSVIETHSFPAKNSIIEESDIIEPDITEPDTIEINPEYLQDIENIEVIINNYADLSVNEKQALADSWNAPVDFRVLRNEDNLQDGDILITGKYEAYMPRINNRLELTDLLIEETPIRFLAPFLRYSYGWNNGVSFSMLCNGQGSSIPMNFLRQIDDGYYYTVVKVKDAGYLYIFYDTFDNAIDATDITDVGAVYIEKTLAYKDFEGINVGSSIDDVRNIDSGIYAWELAREVLYEDCRTDPYNKDCLPGTTQQCDYSSMVSIHLLTDGLLTIVYEKNGDSWIITDMKLSEDFIFDSSITPYTINEKQFKILPQDYPTAS